MRIAKHPVAERVRRRRDEASEVLSPPGDHDSWLDYLERFLPPPVRGIVHRMRHDDILLYSSGLAFYALVSVAPTLVMIMWLASLILGDHRTHQAATEIGRLMPRGVGGDRLFQQVASVGSSIGAIALVTALWPASSYGSGLVRAFERLAPEPESELQGLRGRGLILVFVFPLLLFGGVVVSYASTQLIGGGALGQLAGAVIALATAFVVAALALAVIYRVFPQIDLGWKQISAGTLLAAGSISLLSFAFAAYLNYGSDFKAHYATSGVAAVVLFAVWLFLSNALLLVGFKVALETD